VRWRPGDQKTAENAEKWSPGKENRYAQIRKDGKRPLKRTKKVVKRNPAFRRNFRNEGPGAGGRVAQNRAYPEKGGVEAASRNVVQKCLPLGNRATPCIGNTMNIYQRFLAGLTQLSERAIIFRQS